MSMRKPGAEVREISSGGKARTYVRHVPTELPADGPPSVLLFAHGGESRGTESWDRSWHRHADRGFIIICLTAEAVGKSSHWVALGNGGLNRIDAEDTTYVADVLDEVQRQYGVGVVGISGFSSGGGLTDQMYVTHSHRVDAVAVCAHGLATDFARLGLKPAWVRPTRLTFGTADDNWEGDGGKLGGLATFKAFRGWSGCKGKPQISTEQGRDHIAELREFPRCIPRAQLCIVHGEKHGWIKIREGAPFNEDDRVVEFFAASAGFKVMS